MTPTRVWRRRLRRALIAVVALYAAYLVPGNLFLGTGLGPALLGRSPEKFQAAWDSAWTVWPGRVHVRGLRLRGQSRSARWEAALDEATFDYRVWALAVKRFTVHDLGGSGLAFRLRRRPAADEEYATGPEVPAIPGFSSQPAAPTGPLPPPKRWPWRISLSGVVVTEVREVWIEDQRLLGEGRLGGAWAFTPRGPMELDEVRLEFDGARVLVGPETIADQVRLDVRAGLALFVPREHQGREALRFLSGRVRFESPRSNFGFLDRYFGGAAWLDIQGSGRVLADVPVSAGVLAAGGRVEIADADLALTALEFGVSGRGELEAVVTEHETARLEARLRSFELRRRGVSPGSPRGPTGAGDRSVLARGDDLRLSVVGDSIDLAAARPQLEARLTVADSEIPDLSGYNLFLPPDSALALRSGSGVFAGDLKLSTIDDSASGRFDIRAEQATLALGETRGTGDAHFTLRVRGAELSRQRFDVSGTRLEITNFGVGSTSDAKRSPGWWARVELRDAQIEARQQPSLVADFDARLRDSRPIVTFLAEQKPLLGWIESLLTVEDVSARGRVGLDQVAWSMDGLSIRGEGLEILGESLRLSGVRREALLYFSRGPLSAAVELAGDERDWKLIRARRWYEQRASRR